ncbi:MAG: GNAT family N-acetyltransferase [Planctomycetota bacterium]
MSVSSQSIKDQPGTSQSCQSAQIVHDKQRLISKTRPQIAFKRTDQLTESEREQVLDLFEAVFNKKMTKDSFERKFFYTPKEYSYHGLMLHEKTVVGASSAVPGRYKFFGEEHIFALSVDTMIDPKYRGGGHLIKMINLVHHGLINDGIPFIFGFPNEHFYAVQKRLLKYEDIGELDYYVLPLNIGSVVRKLRPLNVLSRGFCKLTARFCRIPDNSEAGHGIAKVVDKQFERHRYDAGYSRIALGQAAECIYKIYEEEGGIRTLYIIDIVPLTAATLARAVKQICRTAVKTVDIIIYVGKLPSRPAGLWQTPDSKKPQRIRMTGKILIPDVIDSSVFKMNNWSVNISNFDVR